MKYLAIGAHPDDLEIRCYGTLARLKQQGHSIAVCNIANGSLGHTRIPPEELKKIRHDEAKAAAELIGAEHYAIDVNDMEVDSHNQKVILKLVEVIRKVQPDIIFTLDPNDYHPDHVEASLLTFHASFSSSLPQYKTESPCHPEVPIIYYCDTSRGLHFEPTEFVDISDVMEIKIEAFRCHESQLEWLSDHDAVDMEKKVRLHAAFRGYQSGVEYAEAFRLCPKSLRVPAFRVLP